MTDATFLDAPAGTRGGVGRATDRRNRAATAAGYRDRSRDCLATTVATGVEAHVRAALPVGG